MTFHAVFKYRTSNAMRGASLGRISVQTSFSSNGESFAEIFESNEVQLIDLKERTK